MFKAMTNVHKKEIESLIPDHAEALVAYGAYMRNRGIRDGVIYALIGIGVGNIIYACNKLHRSKTDKTE